jgi:hypothetical protein
MCSAGRSSVPERTRGGDFRGWQADGTSQNCDALVYRPADPRASSVARDRLAGPQPVVAETVTSAVPP